MCLESKISQIFYFNTFLKDGKTNTKESDKEEEKSSDGM